MKNKFGILSIIAACFILISCGGETKPTVQKPANPGPIDALVEQYLAVKDALVADNAPKAKLAALTLTTTASSSKVENNTAIVEQARSIANADDINVQREKFETLSKTIFDLSKDGKAHKNLYWQHCPMAFDNKGANWVSDKSEVRNPYFGASMLKCGKVEKEY